MRVETIRIGTRGSQLALTQSSNVRDALQALHPQLRVELVVIKTTGDKIVDVPLAQVGGKGLFVKEIEDGLLSGEVDLAVHSMKDVPSELPEGLIIGAVPVREDPRDVLAAREARSLAELRTGAKVGTSSLRRMAQVLRDRPDVTVESLRGNLDTRLRKLEEGLYDAVILAAAGLHRMGWRNRISGYLDPVRFVPAIGQGAIGIEVRRNDARIREIVSVLHDRDAAMALEAERGFLAELEGGCQVPIGGHARVIGGEVEFTGIVCSLDGKQQYGETRRGPVGQAGALGKDLARALLDAGARTILDAVYGRVPRTGALDVHTP